MNFHIFRIKMKNVVIRGLYAVGMHHWGPRELQINDVFYLKHEPENNYDCNAVAICCDKEKMQTKAYLQRKDAFVIANLFRNKMVCGNFYLKPKAAAEKFRKNSGPMQRCNVGFKSEDNIVDTIRQICNDNSLDFTIF